MTKVDDIINLNKVQGRYSMTAGGYLYPDPHGLLVLPGDKFVCLINTDIRDLIRPGSRLCSVEPFTGKAPWTEYAPLRPDPKIHLLILPPKDYPSSESIRSRRRWRAIEQQRHDEMARKEGDLEVLEAIIAEEEFARRVRRT